MKIDGAWDFFYCLWKADANEAAETCTILTLYACTKQTHHAIAEYIGCTTVTTYRQRKVPLTMGMELAN